MVDLTMISDYGNFDKSRPFQVTRFWHTNIMINYAQQKLDRNNIGFCGRGIHNIIFNTW